jgi:hypothetical protein
LFLLFGCYNLKAQSDEVKLSAFIKNKNGVPIAYATIILQKSRIGAYADSTGNIELKFTASKTDTVFVSAIGYKQKAFNWKTLPKEIILEEDEILKELENVEIIAKNRKTYQKSIGEISRNYPKFSNSIHRFSKGNQVAFFLQNLEKKEGIIKNIYFNIENDKKVKGTKIRVRLYERNRTKNSPDKDLTTKNIIVNVTSSGIIKIDMEDYNILFPLEGCFLGIEFLGNDSQNGNKLVYPYLYGYSPRVSKNIFTEGIWNRFMDRGKWYKTVKGNNPKLNDEILYFKMDIIYFKD